MLCMRFAGIIAVGLVASGCAGMDGFSSASYQSGYGSGYGGPAYYSGPPGYYVGSPYYAAPYPYRRGYPSSYGYHAPSGGHSGQSPGITQAAPPSAPPPVARSQVEQNSRAIDQLGFRPSQ
jgi:hypothetical protein